MEEETTPNPFSSSTTAAPAPAPAPISLHTTTYDHVYCGNDEGTLEVTDRGLFFRPYYKLHSTHSAAIPHDIRFQDVTYKEFRPQQVTAAYSDFSAVVTFYDFKMGIFPSKEVTFHLRQAEEWERLQCDLDARGQGVPFVPATTGEDGGDAVETAAAEGGGVESAFPAPGFHQDDYDFTETVYNDMEDTQAQQEQQQHTDDQQEEGEEDDEAEDAEWEEDMEQNDDEDEDVEEGDEQDDDDDENENEQDQNVGWSAAGTTTAPDSKYYPVKCKNEVGTLILTGRNLQFIPDSMAASIKTLPWTCFSGRPYFSPWNYPQAFMRVHYLTTLGPNKKVGFEVKNHGQLSLLQEDISYRIRPWKNAPREKVFVAPKPKQVPLEGKPPKTKRKFKPKMFRKRKGKPTVVPPPTTPSMPYDVPEASTTFTEDMTSEEFGVQHHHDNDDDDDTSAVPLVRVIPSSRRIKYHKDESPRRQFLLFWSYCCIITLTGLTLSILFGYFFGPRKPREGQYIRTKSPYSIDSYLGTNPPTFPPTPRPTMAPTPLPQESWTSDSVTLSRDNPDAPLPLIQENLRGDGATRPPEDASRGDNDFDVDLPVSTIASSTVTPTDAHSEGPNIAPSLAPSIVQSRSAQQTLQVLMDSSFDGGAALRTAGTPQQAAYLLLKVSGVLDMTPSDAMIMQKYALSTFYYSTGGKNWIEGSSSWADLASSDCVKEHVVCNDATQETIWIDMPANNMVGSIPPEIGFLSQLEYLNLAGNGLEGTIPTEVGLLTKLTSLNLSKNTDLEGTLPLSVVALPELEELAVDLPCQGKQIFRGGRCR